MKTRDIIVTGGGSGGHIVPALAVAAALKERDSAVRIRYILDMHSSYKALVTEHPSVDTVSYIFAGKLRRYHGVSIGRQLLDISTLLKNLRDAVYLLIGFVQAFFLLLAHRPRAIFVKGGFVGVPVGYAAALLRIPYITHDSDTMPGLANRLIARWARWHVVGMPIENYAYPQAKTVEMGVPIDEHRFSVVDEATRDRYRVEAGVPADALVVLVVGGGGGARVIDDAVELVASDLLEAHQKLHIIHIFGKLNEHLLSQRYAKIALQQQSRVHKIAFTHKMEVYSGAADVIVTRAGATNMAEFASQAKACVVIPAAHLVGGHQVKNAQVYEAGKAVVVLDEGILQQQPRVLRDVLSQLLVDNVQRMQLGRSLHNFVKPGAAGRIAKLLLEVSAS